MTPTPIPQHIIDTWQEEADQRIVVEHYATQGYIVTVDGATVAKFLPFGYLVDAKDDAETYARKLRRNYVALAAGDAVAPILDVAP